MSNMTTINYYDSNAVEFIETTKKVDFSEIQQVFMSYLSPDASILDFGCGSGRDTKYFLDHGYHVTATDGSAEICKIATDYIGISVKHLLFEELDDQNQYDGNFIPWSFVMNDELWNLMPMDSSLNSSKSNRLPKWNPFFKVFAKNQYLLYEMINARPDLHKRFEACYRDNLHSIWAGQELYRKGNSREVFCNILEKNMMPVYDSARRQGYEIWNYGYEDMKNI